MGDHVNLMTTLQFLCAGTVKTWLESAEKTLALAGDAPMYVGHGEKPLTKQELETLIGWGRELVAEGNKKPNKTAVKRGEAKFPRIVYKTGRVI